MVARRTDKGHIFHEPPYTEEEEMAAYRAMAGGPVAMTSVTRPSNATPPVSKTGDRPPAKPRR